MPPWYKAFDQWLLGHGWPALIGLAAVIVGVTIWLVATRRAASLAIWLTYLVMP